jgi:hypothetical protein
MVAYWSQRANQGPWLVSARHTFTGRALPQRIESARDPFPPARFCLISNYYSGIQTLRECEQQVSQSGANNGNVLGYMYKDSRYTNLRHKAVFTYDGLNRLASPIAALGRTPRRLGVCATREET